MVDVVSSFGQVVLLFELAGGNAMINFILVFIFSGSQEDVIECLEYLDKDDNSIIDLDEVRIVSANDSIGFYATAYTRR